MPRGRGRDAVGLTVMSARKKSVVGWLRQSFLLGRVWASKDFLKKASEWGGWSLRGQRARSRGGENVFLIYILVTAQQNVPRFEAQQSPWFVQQMLVRTSPVWLCQEPQLKRRERFVWIRGWFTFSYSELLLLLHCRWSFVSVMTLSSIWTPSVLFLFCDTFLVAHRKCVLRSTYFLICINTACFKIHSNHDWSKYFEGNLF